MKILLIFILFFGSAILKDTTPLQSLLNNITTRDLIRPILKKKAKILIDNIIMNIEQFFCSLWTTIGSVFDRKPEPSLQERLLNYLYNLLQIKQEEKCNKLSAYIFIGLPCIIQPLFRVDTNKLFFEMEQNNLFPAIKTQIHPHLGPEEFQQSLQSWFEEKSLLADLRSYLRVQLIKRFKNFGGVNEINGGTFSLPKQAFNLIIAEHLLKEHFLYTLSVFSTEVPKVNHLPFPCFQENNPEWKFDHETVLNVLELMGISKCSADAISISKNYSNGNISLLNCIINCRFLDVKIEDKETEICDAKDYVNAVLMDIRVPPNIIKNIQNKIQENIAEKGDKFNRTNKKNHEIIEELKKQITARNNEIKCLLETQIALKKEFEDLKNGYRKLKKIPSTKSCTLKHCESTCESNHSLIEKLRLEIVKLEENNKEKSSQIEKLHLNLDFLNKELSNSRQKIDFLNTCLEHTNQLSLDEPKEINLDPLLTELSSDDLTEDILKQVKSKLQELERESAELDMKFKNLRIDPIKMTEIN